MIAGSSPHACLPIKLSDTVTVTVEIYYIARKFLLLKLKMFGSSQIQAYFKENTDWSLISFLNFRKGADNFTGDKATEHFNYKTALEKIVRLFKSC